MAPRKKNKTLQPPKRPKLNWVDGVEQVGSFLESPFIALERVPTYAYIPAVQNGEKILSDDLNEQVKHLPLLKDDKGQALVYYHATLENFDSFYPLSFFGTLTTAKNAGFERACCRECFITEEVKQAFAAVQDKKPKDVLEWLRFQRVQQMRIIPVGLCVHNPLIAADTIHHGSREYEKIILNLLEREAYSAALKQRYPILNDFAIAKLLIDDKMNIPPEMDMIFLDPREMTPQAVARELRLEKLFAVAEPYSGEGGQATANQLTNRYHLIMQRMIRFLERRGYDSIAFRNHTDDKGALTYIVLRPENVIRLDKKIPSRIMRNRASAAHNQRLNVYEARALQRYAMKEENFYTARLRQDYQAKVIKDIPPEKIENSASLKALADKFNPGWQHQTGTERE